MEDTTEKPRKAAQEQNDNDQCVKPGQQPGKPAEPPMDVPGRHSGKSDKRAGRPTPNKDSRGPVED